MQKLILFCFALTLTFSIACKKKAGCTNSCATNYTNAKTDDGSCIFVKPIIDYTNYYSDNCKPPYGMGFYTDVTNVSCNVRYEWSFGDGGSSTEKNPYHSYANNGSYTVILKARNETVETSKQFIISLDTSQPTVSNFSYAAENNNYHLPCKISFSNLSNFAGSYYWDFGDGSTSTSTSPTHIYNAAGNYTISLKSNCGSRQSVATKIINVLPKPSTIALTRFSVTNGAQALASDKGTPLYMELQYNNTSFMFSKIVLYKSYPAAWNFPIDIANGSYKVSDAFLNADFFKYSLWLDDLGLNDKILYSVTVDFNYLSTNYFPTNIIWNSNGYRMVATLDYQ